MNCRLHGGCRDIIEVVGIASSIGIALRLYELH